VYGKLERRLLIGWVADDGDGLPAVEYDYPRYYCLLLHNKSGGVIKFI